MKIIFFEIILRVEIILVTVFQKHSPVLYAETSLSCAVEPVLYLIGDSDEIEYVEMCEDH